MNPELWTEYKKNEDIFRQRLEDICQKYANVEDPGFDLCLETLTFQTSNGSVRAESGEAERKLNSLQRVANKCVETQKDLNTTEDTLFTYRDEDDEEQKEDCEDSTALERSVDDHPDGGGSLLGASRVSSSMLSLPEEQDPELERTFSSQSDTPSLQELYPSMLSQIRGACHRQQVSDVASALRRKYYRQRWKVKRTNQGQSFMNSSVGGTMTSRAHGPLNRRAPPGLPMPSAGPHTHTNQARDAGSGQRSSPWKSVTSQVAVEQDPVRVMDFSTPPSSGPSSPSDASLELNQTYAVRTSPSLPHASHHSAQRVRRQEANVVSFRPREGDVGHHTQVFPSPKHRYCEGSQSSPSKVNSVLSSPFHRHRRVVMEDSPPRQQESLSPSRHFPYTQQGLQKTHYSSPSRHEALWTSPSRRSHKTDCPISPQRPSPKAYLWKPEVLSSRRGLAESMQTSHPLLGSTQRDPSCSVFMGSPSPHKQRFLSRECSPSKVSPIKYSPVHSAHSSSALRRSSLPRHPEIYTSPLHHHQSLQGNLRASPNRHETLQTRRRSSSGLQDPGRSLSSSCQQMNQQFRQLYHQHVCQRRSSLSRHGHSGCLCEQIAEGYSPNPTTSPVPASASAITNARLAALSLTPVRRRRFRSEFNPLLKRLQRGPQMYSPLVRQQQHQPDHQQQQQTLYSADDCETSVLSEMSEGGHWAHQYQRAQSSSGGRHHHSGSYSPSTLAALGLAPTHPRLSKRRPLSEPQESPSLKRFRECAQAPSPSRPRGYPPQQQWGEYDYCDATAPVANGLSEEQRTRSRSMLLQCPSPSFLRAAMMTMKAGRSSSRSTLGTRPQTSAWRSPQDRMHEAEEISDEAWNESGMSPSVSRRRLLYGVPRC
ncbi:uncharacterized protein si:dkeyp-117h8.4 isoform X2 [Clupea harengus]|uniref:Uncharacterized protein si:dkeyp-117h8.4 isoform X2 n=1 Tax=Clupea harengus TaxID=7950 RepID=A0A6P8G4C3_CLUHA|nr:uncharacterized protein si:dkeyp-117h8.4 isoform X2 [Clupea harengus]